MIDKYFGFISSDDMRVYVYENTSQNVAMSPTTDVSLFTAPVDAVDIVVLGGLPYYVIQTNYVGNVNANCWGPGLILSREGFAYDKGTYEGTTGLQEDSLQWIIERQGNNSSATGQTLQMVMIVSFISSKIQELQVGIRIVQLKKTKHIMLII